METSDIPIRLVAQDGALDEQSPDSYREMYDELRKYDPWKNSYAISLDKFVEAFGAGGPSKAEWSRYHRGERDLSRDMRNCLRTASGLSALSPTIDEIVREHVEPNARVYKVGDEPVALRVVLLATWEPVTIHANGDVKLLNAESAKGEESAEKNHPSSGDVHRSVFESPVVAEQHAQSVQRRTDTRAHVSMARSAFEQANTMRQYCGLSWEEMFDVALEVLAKQAAEEAGDADATIAAA